MIQLLFDETMRQFVIKHPTHPYVIELSIAVTNAQFELTKETLDDMNIAIGKLVIFTGGDIQCVIEPGEQPYTIEGNA
jgi:hypothetical protein